MAEYKGVSGALYTNSYKSSENQPDYTGEVDLSRRSLTLFDSKWKAR